MINLAVLCLINLIAIGIAEPQVSPVNPLEIHLTAGHQPAPTLARATAAREGDFPFVASVWFVRPGGEYSYGCGGALIHPRWVLTAAHCFNNGANAVVMMGSVHMDNMTYIAWADKIYVHQEYNYRTRANDIALIKLPWSASGENIAPVQIAPRGFAPLDGEIVRSTGFNGSNSNVLLRYDLNVVSNERCRAVWTGINGGQMCAIQSTREGEQQNTCRGDSGSPVIYTDPRGGNTFVAGITSYDGPCAPNVPSVNTLVSAYVDWIKWTTNRRDFSSIYDYLNLNVRGREESN